MAIAVTNGGVLELAEHGQAYRVFQSMSNEVNAPKVLFCPADSKKQPATNFFNLNNGNISYFIGLDASETNPQSVLLGDDNLVVNRTPVRSGLLNLLPNDVVEWSPKRHQGGGNVALTDGSVQQDSNMGLKVLRAETNSVMNRLVIP